MKGAIRRCAIRIEVINPKKLTTRKILDSVHIGVFNCGSAWSLLRQLDALLLGLEPALLLLVLLALWHGVAVVALDVLADLQNKDTSCLLP